MPGKTVLLAERHHLTVYDAAYLELALRRALPLATLDRELRTAAEAEAVVLWDCDALALPGTRSHHPSTGPLNLGDLKADEHVSESFLHGVH